MQTKFITQIEGNTPALLKFAGFKSAKTIQKTYRAQGKAEWRCEFGVIYAELLIKYNEQVEINLGETPNEIVETQVVKTPLVEIQVVESELPIKKK